MSNESPRPNINHSKDYFGKVKNIIKTNNPVQEIHFEYLIETFDKFGFNIDIYSKFLLGNNNTEIEKIVEEIFQYINSKELSEEELFLLYRMWDYLAESDRIDKADLIYVFGGISDNAVNEAIRLKLENYAPKILFSGKRASYMNDTEISEAEKYEIMAIEKGVLKEDVIIEKESINTPENIVKSAELLHSIDFLPKKIIAVSLPYHMKRASLTMLAGFDWDFELIRHTGVSAKYTRENYFKDKNGWKYICFEYLKLYIARQMGHF